ncbi:MAG: hypothetical protein K2X47_05355 [Bdellovibrionales bacterium]|nr:hypothetical protein [Bdellovibrionales bacterium]
MRTEDLRIVILKCPYANWSHPRVQDLFCKVIDLKLKGYQSRYRFGVMPIDATDFVTDHILICEETKQGLKPILGAKSLCQDICSTFHLDFTPEAFFRKAGNAVQLGALQSSLAEVKRREGRISYFSSWTMDLEIKKDLEATAELKELFIAAGVGAFREEGVTDLFGIGLPKFKTDAYFFDWGFQRANFGGEPTPNFTLPNFGNLDAVFMHLSRFSDHAEKIHQRYSKLWSQRLTVGRSVRDLKEIENISAAEAA